MRATSRWYLQVTHLGLAGLPGTTPVHNRIWQSLLIRSPPDQLIQTSSCELFAIWLPHFPESFPPKWHHRIILVPIVRIVFFQRNCLVDLCTGDRYWLEIGELRREVGGNKGQPREGGSALKRGIRGRRGSQLGINREILRRLNRRRWHRCIGTRSAFDALGKLLSPHCALG